MAAAAALNARVGSCLCCCSCVEAPLQCLWPGAGCQAAQRPERPGSVELVELVQPLGKGGGDPPPHVCLAGPDEPAGLAELAQALPLVRMEYGDIFPGGGAPTLGIQK